MSPTSWIIILASLPLSLMGLLLFFGSDYAQKRWNPDYKSPDEQHSDLIIVRDYRTRPR